MVYRARAIFLATFKIIIIIKILLSINKARKMKRIIFAIFSLSLSPLNDEYERLVRVN